MRLMQVATEEEVIVAFLRNEYHQKEYDVDREQYEALVFSPNLNDGAENAIRRELLFRRHRVTWSELPSDIAWHVCALDRSDIDRIRIFPRGHWPKMVGDASLTLRNVARAIQQREYDPSTIEDVTAIHDIAQQLRSGPNTGAVLFIGLNEHSPFTVLEGNHRLIAAALLSDEAVLNFSTFVGLTPNMTQCFWYESSAGNFIRHAIRRCTLMQPRVAALLGLA